jgi:hypothetical protein
MHVRRAKGKLGVSSRRVHAARIALALVLLVIVAQIGIAAYAIATDTSEAEPDVPIVPATGITSPLDLEAAAVLGLDIARDWRSDAILVNAGMQVDWPDDSIEQLPAELPRGGWAILRYLSGGDMLTLRVDRGSGVVVETELLRLAEEDAAHLAAHAIDFVRASTNSATAVLAAEAAYGQRYRAACPERRRESWVGVITDESGGRPAWFVRYQDNGQRETTTLSVRIDWASGDVYDVVDLDPNCFEEPD